ncbi:MAG: COX15/CtaA family protein [Chloroflexi bacterium]|nr:COX15/CtaA family protein [Chloroflexota bacterium]
MKTTSFSNYAWFVLVLNIAVILWGAYVRASGSGAGCGSHWPLCNNQVVPAASQVATLIEFAHRVTSGLALLMVLGMLVWARREFPAGHPARAGAAFSMAMMITEAVAGAGLVLFNWTAFDISLGRIIVMPVHLLITFSLLAALSLTVWWASGGAAIRWRGQGARAWMLGIGLFVTLLMGMAGAVTALGDTVLPVASLTPGHYESLSPAGQLLVSLRVWHPLIAVAVAAYLLFVVNTLRASKMDADARRFSTTLVVLFAIELGAGVLNIYLLVPIWMQLLHLLLADLVWIVLILLTAATLRSAESG